MRACVRVCACACVCVRACVRVHVCVQNVVDQAEQEEKCRTTSNSIVCE